jgi:hypothetical protein
MVKKLIILAYIMAVLVLSGMVKADGLIKKGRGLVESAEISPTGILHIEGVLVTPCHHKPTLVVNNIDEARGVLALTVQTTVANGVCPDVISSHFQLVFDMKTLPLRVGNSYNVVFDDISGSRDGLNYVAVSGQSAEDYNLEKKDFKGVLVSTAGNDQIPPGVALQKDNELVPVISPDMLPELTTLLGQVQITGYAVSIATLNHSTESLAPSSQGQNFAQVIVPVSVTR